MPTHNGSVRDDGPRHSLTARQSTQHQQMTCRHVEPSHYTQVAGFAKSILPLTNRTNPDD